MENNDANVAAFVKLMRKYQSITQQEIDEATQKFGAWEYGGTILHQITGFGGTTTCSLCIVAGHKPHHMLGDCSKCLWSVNKRSFKCLGKNYTQIRRSKNSAELLSALSERVQLMSNRLKFLGINESDYGKQSDSIPSEISEGS